MQGTRRPSTSCVVRDAFSVNATTQYALRNTRALAVPSGPSALKKMLLNLIQRQGKRTLSQRKTKDFQVVIDRL